MLTATIPQADGDSTPTPAQLIAELSARIAATKHAEAQLRAEVRALEAALRLLEAQL